MAKRTDANQQQIIDAVRAVGAAVYSLHKIGSGSPDLAIGYRGRNYLVEVKVPGGKLNKMQVGFKAMWAGQYDVVSTVDEALRVIGAIRSK